MARNDKKHGVDGWYVSGLDSMGRPSFKKHINPKNRRAYKDTAKRALDPMADVRKKVDTRRIDSLPHEFTSTFYGDGGSWDDVSEDGNTLYGTHHESGKKVVMSRHGNEIIIAVNNEVVEVLGPAEERELKIRHIENEIHGEPINRKYIADVNLRINEETNEKHIEMDTVEGSKLTYKISPDGKSATGWITTTDESGQTTTTEIAQNIPTEDIAELSSEISEQEGKRGSLMSTAAQAVMIGKYLKREWRKRKGKGGSARLPDPPFSKSISQFFSKAFIPFEPGKW